MSKPFTTIAMAIANSPDLEVRIQESIRFKEALGHRLILICLGDEDESERQNFQSVVDQKVGASRDEVEILWRQGEAVDVMLDVAAEYEVDLIIADAQPREGLLRYYMGSVARQLIKAPDCNSSILLRTKPAETKELSGRMVVNGLDHPKTPYTIEKAVSVASGFESSELVVVEEVESSGLSKQDDQRITSILNAIQSSGQLQISHKHIAGKAGYAIGHFAETFGADLLIMSGPDTKLGFRDRVFTNDLEYILSELPCDLLMVNSKKPVSI